MDDKTESQEASNALQALVELMAKAVVDEPELVKVIQVDGETLLFELRVSPGDLGKVIGKQGRMARSMRIILGAAGMKQRKRCELEIVEEE